MENFSYLTRPKLLSEIRRLEILLRETEENSDPGTRMSRQLELHRLELEVRNQEMAETSQRLFESESRYAALYRLAPIGFCTLDEIGHIHEINLAAAELLGQPPESLRGKSLPAVAAGLSAPDLWDHLRRCRERNGRTTTQLTFEREGRRFQIALVSAPVPMADQATQRFHTAIVDLSSEKLAQERLRLLGSLGQQLVATHDEQGVLSVAARLLVPFLGDCAVATIEAAGGGRAFAVAHDRAHDLQRLEAEVEAGKLPPELLSLAEDAHRGAAMFPAQGVIGTWMFPERKAGTAVVAPICGRSRRLGFLLVGCSWARRALDQDDLLLCHEVAQRLGQALENIHLYQQALRDLRVRENFVSIVSHDLVNAATSIKLASEVAQVSSQMTEPRGALAFAAKMARAAEWISSLVRNLLDLAQLETGRLSVDREPLPVASLAGDAVEILAVAAGARQISIRVDIGRAGWVHADAGRITQVLLNLVGNAVKASPPGSEVVLRAEPRDGQVYFSVEDRGPGMPLSDVEHVFDRHWQAQRRQHAGVGLGLAIARAIVEAHGGRLGVESKPGAGTTLWFSLEAATPPGLSEPGPPPGQQQAGGKGWS